MGMLLVMAEKRVSRVETVEPRIRNVPIAVTPEGFWCCPAPIVFQKPVKPPSPPPPKSSVRKKQTPANEAKSSPNPSLPAVSNDPKGSNVDSPSSNGPVASERTPRNKGESLPSKVSIEFGEPGTSNLKVVLRGKHGFSVKLNVHKDVLVESSSFFAEKLCEEDSGVVSLEFDECEDVEGFVETVGLMYSKDMKLRLIKQSVQRVLRILKVAEAIAFSSCVQSCLDYLEAVPWVGEEEEEKVVSSVLQLQSKGTGVTVSPILKRVASDTLKPPKDTLSHILDLVLKSTEEKGRREMKSMVLNLLKENNNNNSNSDNNSSSSLACCDSLAEICHETIYNSCRSCLDSLLSWFKEASEVGFSEAPKGAREPVRKHIALEADNLLWLVDILADRRAADELAAMWGDQRELAALHARIPTMTRFHVSCITARLFVGIKKGEILPRKDTRHRLLETWLEPLMGDYNWLQHGCRSFDRKVVEEGIGRTILTLPLEDQQSILLSWMGRFMRSGDGCPDLQKTFEVWWRRTFIQPHSAVRARRRCLSDHLMETEEGVD